MTEPNGTEAVTPIARSEKMKAIVYERYGPPESLELRDIPKPEPRSDEVLVEVHAVSVQPLDWHLLRGKPYLARLTGGLIKPKKNIPGVDFSGVVVAYGSDVTGFEVGDDVWGEKSGACAQYLNVPERLVHRNPSGRTHAEMATVGVPGVTALQGLRDRGGIKEGHKVLVNGASGGVGIFAIQLAKHFGAEVTGVCSSKNVEMVSSLGADRVIDYTKEDFTTLPDRYDLVFDLVANHRISEFTSVLSDEGTYVSAGAPPGNWIGPVVWIAKTGMRRNANVFLARSDFADMEYVGDLLGKGEIRVVIDRVYPLAETGEAIKYVETGRVAGKVIVEPQA